MLFLVCSVLAETKLGCEVRVLKLHELLRRDKPPLVSGYAPFCKHIFVENFTDAKVSTLPITKENKDHIRYAAGSSIDLVWVAAMSTAIQHGRLRQCAYAKCLSFFALCCAKCFVL